MKKAERNGENSSSGRKNTSFGLQLGEKDVASSVMGGIVEKGFNMPVSQPQVTALPFPVARHRSHGPHWVPRTSNLSDHGKDEEDDGEDEDHTNFDLVAADANPIKRKQKKGLDFRRWQEIINSDDTAEFRNKKEHKSNSNTEPCDLKKGPACTNSEVAKSHERKVGDVGIDGVQRTIGVKEVSKNVMVEAQEELNTTTSRLTSNSSVDAGSEQGSTSMESEIDAENNARLEKMSTNEIAEAQAEIMKKMNPALIKILQKRGQEKTRKKSSSSSAISSIDNAQNTIITNPNHKQTGLEGKDLQEIKPSANNLWDAWSTNVEATRDLRFSLDGNVINDYSELPSNASAMGIYSGENASERDFLRTEGDPGALGYTIKEALALTRSVVPGQRALALHLLASVLNKAQANILRNKSGSTLKISNQNKIVDWEALWAFALGPEPELALSLRMCLDDNHNSVVIACARVIQCALSYDFNELFFDTSEKTGIYDKDVCTAPIFRSRSKIDVGFLHAGFWKYNTKPSNIFPFDKISEEDEPEDEHTIKDDIVVATQDIAAGLVRMGILPRIRYLLESDPSAALEECLISILVAIARHSPTCADAIMKCERLVHVVIHRFTTKDQTGIDFSKIKSIILMKVLARSERKRCKEFVDNDIFQKLMWHLYRSAISFDHWLNLEKEKFKILSALLVEQLRFWKVCVQYGYSVSHFSDLFPALYIWLDIPTFDKLIGKNILREFTAISKEAYLVLEALTRTLPNFYSQKINQTTEDAKNDTEAWCWSHVGPMIDLALKWVSLKHDPYLSSILFMSEGTKNEGLTSMLWVISSVFRMLFGVLKNVIPEDDSSILDGKLPWLPEFVPKIGLHIIKNELLSFAETNKNKKESGINRVGSLVEFLCQYRHQSDQETSLASVCCLNGLVEVVVSVNKLIHLANTEIKVSSIEHQRLEIADKILTDGILKCSISEMTTLLTTFMKLTSYSGQFVQSIEMFGRGGPAPGVGVGWGASGGGFWSSNILLTQMDARLVLQLFEIFTIDFDKENPTNEEVNIIMERVNFAFDLCVLVGPRDGIIMEKVLDILLQPSVLKWFDFGIRRSINFNKGFNLNTFGWQYTVDEYLMISDNLISHFKNRWLYVKKSNTKAKTRDGNHGTSKKSKFSLDTIQEDLDTSAKSLVTEWAHQRLPLPHHWFLSPISTVDYAKVVNLSVKPNFPEVAGFGLFFLLGLEAISSHVSSYSYSIQSVPVIWKLHALSVTLFAGMDILEEEKTRDIYGTLQEFYGRLLDKKLLEIGRNDSVDLLKFDKEIHDSYSTFVETLVENFAGASYGDLLYGRQISMYLHRSVGAPVRLAVWNALSNIRALELLPPLEKCLAQEEGYLEPMEEDEMILEAYVKSWVSNALDRSVNRQSVAFTLVIHHLSYFIFGNLAGDKFSLRNKLAKSILRDYSRRPEHEGMMVKLIQYKKAATHEKGDQAPEIARRLTVFSEACEGNSTLLSVVEKLKNAIPKHQ